MGLVLSLKLPYFTYISSFGTISVGNTVALSPGPFKLQGGGGGEIGPGVHWHTCASHYRELGNHILLKIMKIYRQHMCDGLGPRKASAEN